MSFHFLSVNRGRYLCRRHGAFCDNSDGYAVACPLCSEDAEKAWIINPIDRALQILGKAQARSKRSLGTALGFLGAASFVGVAEKLTGISALKELDLFGPALLISVCLLLISVVLFAFSMRHMPVTEKGAFQKLELSQWEEKISSFLSSVEKLHWIANWFLGAAVVLFAVNLVVTPIVFEIQVYCFERVCSW